MSRIALLLLIIAATSSGWPIRQLYRRINKITGQQYLIAPELYHDRNFATATFNITDNSSSSFTVQIILMGVSDTRCNVKIPIEAYSTRTGVDSIRWLMDGSILLSTYHEFDNSSNRRTKLILVDVQSCEHSYPYHDFFPETHKIFTSAVSTTYDNLFAVLVYDRRFCGGADWCRFVYNSPMENTFEPLDFDFSWESSDVQPATTFDDHLFVVRIHDVHSHTFKIRLYYATRRWYGAPMYEELLEVPSNENVEAEKYLMPGRTGILTSGLNVCWISKWDPKTIHCSAFDENGRILFNKTLNYPEPLILYRMKSIPGGLLLLTKKYECKDDDCLDVFATEITNRFTSLRDNFFDSYYSNMPQGDDVQRVRYRKMRIECSHPEVIQAQLYDCEDDAIGRVYVCDNEKQLLYHYVAVRHHTSLFY